MCLPQSKCLTSDECRLNIWTHPNSGHVNNRHLLAASTSTLDSSDDSSTQSELPSTSVTGFRPPVRLGLTGTKLVIVSLVEGLISIVGSSDCSGTSNLIQEILFPGQCHRLPTFLSLSGHSKGCCQSSLSTLVEGTLGGLHNFTQTPRTPLEDSIASFICAVQLSQCRVQNSDIAPCSTL